MRECVGCVYSLCKQNVPFMIAASFSPSATYALASILDLYIHREEYSRMKGAFTRRRTAITAANILLGVPALVYLLLSARRRETFLPPAEEVASALLHFPVTEVVFYATHRFLHHPYLYSRIHRIHHELKTTVGPYALLAHPLEGVLINFSPVIATDLLYPGGCSSFNILLAVNVACFNTVFSAHSELQRDGPHCRHHAYRNCNYGIFYVADVVCGTMR